MGTEDRSEARLPWWRAILRATFLVLFWILVFVATFVASFIYHLDSAPARAQFSEGIGSLLSSTLEGEFSLALEELSLDDIEVHDFVAKDADGVTVLEVPRAWVDISRKDLFMGRLVVEAVRVEQPYANLEPDPESGELRIARAFTPTDPTPEDPNAPPPNIPRILVEDVLLEGGRVERLSPDLDVRGLRVVAEGVVDDRIDIHVIDIDGELVRRVDGAVVATVEKLEGQVGLLEEGARTEIELRVDAMGDDFVAGTAGMTWGAALAFDGSLDFHASPDTLTAAGIPEVEEILESPVSGHVEVDGDVVQRLQAELDLSTEGGDLLVRAALSEQMERIEAHVETESFDLAKVLVPVEEGRFEGTIDATMAPPDEQGLRPIEVDGAQLVYDHSDGNTYRVPELHAEADLGEDFIQVREVDVPGLGGEGGHLDVEGRIGFDGAVDVAVDANFPDLGSDSNLEQLVPGQVDGALVVDARVKIDPQRGMQVDADGRVEARNLRLPWLTARYVEIDGRVEGEPPAPLVDAKVRARGVDTGDFVLSSANVRIDGGPQGDGSGRYRIRGDVDGQLPEANLDSTVDVVARLDADGVGVDGSAEVRGLWSTPLTAELDSVRYEPSTGLRADRVTLRSGDGMALTAAGFLDMSGNRSGARLELTNVDLAKIGGRFGVDDLGLRGIASAEIDFQGSMDAPILSASARVEEMEVGGVPFEQLQLEAGIEQESRGSVVAIQAEVQSSGNGTASIDARGSVPSRSPFRAIERADWDATITTEDFRLGLLAEVLETFPPLDGKIDTRVVLDGTIQDPERLYIDIEARDVVYPGFATVDVLAEAEVAGDDLQLAARVLYPVDEDPLVTVRGSATGVDVLGLATSDSPLDFLTRPWTLEVDVPERSVSAMPRPISMPVPMTGALQARFSGGQQGGGGSLPGVLQGVQGQIDAFVRATEAASQTSCAEGRPQMTLTATIADERVDLRVLGEIAGKDRLMIEAGAATPFSEWVRNPPEAPPKVELDVVARDLPLQSIPYVCRYASGQVNMDLEGRELLADRPQVALQARIDDFVVGESEPLRFEMQGGFDAGKAQVNAMMRARDRVAFRAEAKAPIVWGGENLIPALGEGRWAAEARFDEAPLGPFLAVVPFIKSPEGLIDGEARASGTLDDIEVGGHLELKEAGFILQQPYLRVEDMSGGVRLAGNQLRIDELRFADRDGKAKIDGRIVLEDFFPRSVDLSIKTNEFPLRVEGVIYAFVDTRTDVRATFGEEENEVAVQMNDTAIRLPPDIARGIQALTQHPDVIYEDQPGFDPNATVDVVEGEGGPSVSPFADRTSISVDSDPFWVRREDFAVQVRPDIEVLITHEGTRLTGPVQIRRGFLSFMGRDFDLERGEVRFTGGNTIDPLVDIEASRDVGQSEVITAHITGHLLQPQLDFTSSSDPNLSDSEAIQIIVRGRAGDSNEDAGEQARSFLTGMFAGVLSSVTNQHVGDFVPVLGIGTQDGASTLRVGFQADQLIPDALADIILGAYVEGYVGGGANSNNAAGSAVIGGAVVEFVLPRNLVWTGTYDIPSNWSIDLTWEP